MHLLNTSTLRTQEFVPGKIPGYLILSHRWRDQEISYKTLKEHSNDLSSHPGWPKITSFCSLAKNEGWEWAWMDTCCIDKSSSAELSEAINSMYRWYQNADLCIAHLSDIFVVKEEPGVKRQLFVESEWFK